MAAIKALQQWCKLQCDGYQDVAISNMTSSFRDGLAFCALIHKFRPDLINFESLSKDDVFYNNHLAFRVAEEHLGIPALLDAEDMVALPVPDRLSILTYVSQYYNYFHGRSPIGGVGGLKRHADYSTQVPSEKKNLHVVTKNYNLKTDMENFPPQTEKPKVSKDVPAVTTRKSGSEKQVLAAPSQQPQTERQKLPGLKCLQTSVSPLRERSTHPHCDAEKSVLVESSNKSGTLKSECAVCGSHVHLVQRHLVDGQLYHRSCYKCSVCYGTLKSGAYKVGLDTGRLVCAVHQQAQNAFKPSVKPFRSSGFTPADLVAKSTEIQPSRKYSSVLSIPIKPAPLSVNLSPATHSWTASAQRTQDARKKFFLSCPTAEHQPTMTQQQDHFDFSSSLKMEEQDRTGSAMNKTFPEGNRNNNNALDFNPEMKRICVSAEVSSQRMKVQSYSSSIMATNQATASSISIISVKTKEMFTVSSTNKDRSRPPFLDISSPKGAPAENGLGHEVSSASRSKPKAPKGSGVKRSDLLTNQSCCRTASSSHFNGSFIHASVIEQLNVCGPVSPGLLSVTSSSTQPILVKPSCGAQTCVGIDAKPENSTASILPLHCCHKPSSKEPFWGSAQSTVDISSKVELMHQMVSPTIKPCQITQELQEIEHRLNDLENEGVELEWRLRVYEEEGHGEHLLDPLMVDWFHLIRKKQSYIRRESELIYIARTQDLEEQQPGVEGELRRLINKPERFKTPDEKKREMQLMQKLMEIVNDRNTIVEELEEDRIREEEEDQQLNEMMLKLGLKKCKRKRQSSFSKLFRRSKKASAGE